MAKGTTDYTSPVTIDVALSDLPDSGAAYKDEWKISRFPRGEVSGAVLLLGEEVANGLTDSTGKFSVALKPNQTVEVSDQGNPTFTDTDGFYILEVNDRSWKFQVRFLDGWTPERDDVTNELVKVDGRSSYVPVDAEDTPNLARLVKRHSDSPVGGGVGLTTVEPTNLEGIDSVPPSDNGKFVTVKDLNDFELVDAPSSGLTEVNTTDLDGVNSVTDADRGFLVAVDTVVADNFTLVPKPVEGITSVDPTDMDGLPNLAGLLGERGKAVIIDPNIPNRFSTKAIPPAGLTKVEPNDLDGVSAGSSDTGKFVVVDDNDATNFSLVDAPEGDGDPDAIDTIEDRLRTLDVRTEDLRPGPASTGWGDITADTAGAIAVKSGSVWVFGDVTSATWSAANPSSPGSKYVAVRVPLAAKTILAQYRLVVSNNSGTLSYDDPLTGLTHLGDDATYAYYSDNRQLGGDVGNLTLQSTSSAAHVGASEYLGGLDKGKVYEQVKDIVSASGQLQAAANNGSETVEITYIGGVKFTQVLAATSIRSTASVVRTAAEVNALPDWFFVELTGVAGGNRYYDTSVVRKAALAGSNNEFQIGFKSGDDVQLQIVPSGAPSNAGALTAKVAGSVTSATIAIYV